LVCRDVKIRGCRRPWYPPFENHEGWGTPCGGSIRRFKGGPPAHDLRGGAGAVALGEEDVVVLAAVEWGIEIDEVDGFVLNVLAEDDQVVAVIKTVLLHCGHSSAS